MSSQQENETLPKETAIERYDRIIKETDDDGAREMAQGARDMLLFDISLNSVCCRLGENFHKTVKLEENPEENALEIKQLLEEEEKLLDMKDAIYSGDESVMYAVLNKNKK